jgi:pimeloyl-ACP methyl ester carboxylesterase
VQTEFLLIAIGEYSMTDSFFTTSDGAKLHYVTGGEGAPLLLLTGFGVSTEDYSGNFDELTKHYFVISLDYRAHGKSETPRSGWHIERLAKDVYELLEHLGIGDFFVASHSMGNTVVWCFMMLFGQERIKGYIFEDESPCLLADPSWSEEEQNRYMGRFRVKSQWDFTPFGEVISEESLAFRTKLVREHLCRDWRDVIPTIKVPTLILVGEASHFGSPELWAWLHDSIEGSELVVFGKDEGGIHDMHEANPDKYNSLVLKFLSERGAISGK